MAAGKWTWKQNLSRYCSERSSFLLCYGRKIRIQFLLAAMGVGARSNKCRMCPFLPHRLHHPHAAAATNTLAAAMRKGCTTPVPARSDGIAAAWQSHCVTFSRLSRGCSFLRSCPRPCIRPASAPQSQLWSLRRKLCHQRRHCLTTLLRLLVVHFLTRVGQQISEGAAALVRYRWCPRRIQLWW